METLILALALSTEPSPQEAAAIQHDLAKAQAAIDTRYGHKRPLELPNETRQALIREQAEAERRVLEAHAVSTKDWVRSQARRDRAAQAEVKRELAALVEKEKSAEAQKPEGGEGKPVTVQRGFGEHAPVALEEAPVHDGTVAVERGLPPEVQEETDLLADHDRLEASGDSTGKSSAAQRKARAEKGR
jgi:hypothetical protein